MNQGGRHFFEVLLHKASDQLNFFPFPQDILQRENTLRRVVSGRELCSKRGMSGLKVLMDKRRTEGVLIPSHAEHIR